MDDTWIMDLRTGSIEEIKRALQEKGWKMSDTDIGRVMERAAILVKSAALYARFGSLQPAGLYAGLTNPGVVLEYVRCESGTMWVPISPQLGWSVTSLIKYDGKLFAAVITYSDIYSSVGRIYRYDAPEWTLIGTLDNQVTFLIVYKGELYAGTATPARLYKYIPETASWTKVLEYTPWFGFRSAYVWGDWLYLGEWYWDRFARWNGKDFQEFQPEYLGSCIFDFEEYQDHLYAGAYIGRIYKITSEPATATAIWGPEPYYRYAWSLKQFKSYLYVGFDAGMTVFEEELIPIGSGIALLYRYDGENFVPIWEYHTPSGNPHEGIISMESDGTYLYVGVGAQAVGYPTYMSGEGVGKVYRTSDGINFEPMSDKLGAGVQTLYYLKPMRILPPFPVGYWLASPADLVITDPEGIIITKSIEIEGLSYVEIDTDDDGRLEDVVIIWKRKSGDYLIDVVPEPGADPMDIYTLKVLADGITITLAENVQIRDIPTQPYIVRLTEREVIPIIPATIDVDPDVLNLKSRGKWVTVYIELPRGHGYNVSMIDLTSVILNGQVLAETEPIEIGDYDSDGTLDLMLKFERRVVQKILWIGDKIEIVVSGKLIDGRLFEGKDMIRIISSP